MAQVRKTVIIHHSAASMFTLVDDVLKYPEFLPWCGGIDLIAQNDTSTIATLHIDYHGLKQHFTTENHKTYPSEMQIQLKDGPFKRLDGAWRFTALSDGACKIEFMLNYEFSNAFLEKIIAPVFSHIANTFVDGFVARADKYIKPISNICNQESSLRNIMDQQTEITVEVAYALPTEQLIVPVKVQQDTTAEQAILSSGILKKFPDIDLTVNKIGIFGKLARLDTASRHHDRVEIYRPLIADPKEVRKQRAADGKVMRKGGGDLPGENSHD